MRHHILHNVPKAHWTKKHTLKFSLIYLYLKDVWNKNKYIRKIPIISGEFVMIIDKNDKK